MAAKKMIELSFSDDNKLVTSKEIDKTKSPDESFKKINFDGLIIGVKKRSPTNIKLEESTKSVTSTGTVQKQAQVISKSEVAMKPNQPVKPIVKTQAPVLVVKPTVAEPLMAQARIQVQAKKHENEVTNVTAPAVTKEDWEIFKQFMDLPQPKPQPPVSQANVENKRFPQGASEINFLIKNQEDFVCSVCERFITRRQGVELKACLHNVCRDCLIHEITHNHDTLGQVKCPFTAEKCEAFVSDEEVKVLLGETYDRFALKIMQSLHNEVDKKKRKIEAIALIKTDDFDFIENAQEFECKICYTDVDAGAGVTLKNCHHQFCKECFVESVKHSEEVTVKCPFMDDEGKGCEFTIQEREIRGLVPAELFEKYLERSLNVFQATTGTTHHCKTPDCKGFIEVGKNVLGFKCFLCKMVNCIACKTIHHGKNCQQYQEEVNPNAKHIRENVESENAIKHMIARGEAMFCPKCGIPVMKQSGCDFITCVTCKLGICWVTRKPRQPFTKENGTFVDGCHCRETGDLNRCHPQCNFCH